MPFDTAHMRVLQSNVYIKKIYNTNETHKKYFDFSFYYNVQIKRDKNNKSNNLPFQK